MKSWMSRSIMGGLSLWSVCSLQAAQSGEQRPNVILIYADDLGAGLLGCYGQQIIKTPNIDRLAQQGVKFTQAHGCMYCAPARASLLTGLHDSHAGAWSIQHGGLVIAADKGEIEESEIPQKVSGAIQAKEGEIFLPQLAQQAGYVTAQFGKLDWGFTTTHERLKRHGWDYYLGYMDHVRAHGFYPTFLWKNGEKLMLPGNIHKNAGKTWEGGYASTEATKKRRDKTGKVHYSQNVMIEDLLKFIEHNRKRPFFIYHSTQLPHGPVDVPAVHPDFVHDERLTDVQKEYASMVKMLDDHVGLIMQKLNELKLDRRTMVIFTSDNGHELYYVPNKGRGRQRSYHGDFDPFKGSMDLAGLKWTNWQGGIHVPLIVRWPGRVKPGKTTHRLTAAYDYMPTLAEVMGVKVPEGKDGQSFLPTLMGKPQSDRGYIVVNQAVISDGWKLVSEKGQFLLFNLRKDPGERDEVAAEFPEKVAELKAIFKKEVGSKRRDLSLSQ